MRTPDGLLFLDRTRNATDFKCRRRRFLAFEWHRRGISPFKRGQALELGSIMHDAYASFLLNDDVNATVEAAVARLTAAFDGGQVHIQGEIDEQRVLLGGMLRGWARLVLPRILEEYEVVRVEGEVQYDFLGCRLGAKPDVLLRRRSDRTLWYVEWKTTSTMSPEYFASWTKAVQLHAGALGVARTLGEEIEGAIVFCLYKGFWSKKYKRQESIFCHGYGPRDMGGAVMLGYTYRPGLIKHPIIPEAVAQWVRDMPMEVLEAQFGDTGPILLDERLCEAWLRQTAMREKEIDHALSLLYDEEGNEIPTLTNEGRQEIMDRYFPQAFDQCLPVIGPKCDYNDCCHVRSVGENPLRNNLFVLRQPHHTTDPVMMWLEEE